MSTRRKHAKLSARSTAKKPRFSDVFSDADYPYGENDAIGPTEPMPMASLKGAPDAILDLSKISAPLSQRSKKRERLAEATEKRLRDIEQSKRRWSHGAPEQMDKEHEEKFEEGLVRFFRSGFEKNFNEGRHATKEVILTFIKEVIKQYRLRISGGFVLKNMGLSIEDASKPSVDIDIYVPFYIPNRYPEFYEAMALLFNCDPGTNDRPFKIKKFVTNRAAGAKKGFFKKNGIYSVFKHERNVDGVYAEMDLVRGNESQTPERIIRNFDLSVCMNWYNGEHIYAMDKQAILDKEGTTGWLNYSYLHLLLGIKNEHGTKWKKNPVTRDRILKYLLRGYRISYVHPTEGIAYEIMTDDLPNAIHRLPKNKREKYYRDHALNVVLRSNFGSKQNRVQADESLNNPENEGEEMVNNTYEENEEKEKNANNVQLRSHFGGTRKRR